MYVECQVPNMAQILVQFPVQSLKDKAIIKIT